MDVEVWWCSLTAAEPAILDMLDGTERARVDALERSADRARSLLGAALLRVAVAESMGVTPAEVVIDRTCGECGAPHGAPRIVGSGSPKQWVSVSHSGLLVVVAVSRRGPVGVDVQRLADLDDPTLGSRWVRTEALLKARTTVQPQPGAPTQLPLAVVPLVRDLSTPLDGYAAALAAMMTGPMDVSVRQWPGAAQP